VPDDEHRGIETERKTGLVGQRLKIEMIVQREERT